MALCLKLKDTPDSIPVRRILEQEEGRRSLGVLAAPSSQAGLLGILTPARPEGTVPRLLCALEQEALLGRALDTGHTQAHSRGGTLQGGTLREASS